MKYILIILLILFIISNITKKKEGFFALPGLNPLRTQDNPSTSNLVDPKLGPYYMMDSMKYYDPTYWEMFDKTSDPIIKYDKCNGVSDDFIHDRKDNYDEQDYITYGNRTLARNLAPHNYNDYANACDASFTSSEKYMVVNTNRTRNNTQVPFQAHNFYWNGFPEEDQTIKKKNDM